MGEGSADLSSDLSFVQIVDPASTCSSLCFVNSKWTTVALKFNRCSRQSVAVDRASEVEARLVTQESSRRTHRSFPAEILRASISLAMVSADRPLMLMGD